MPKAFTELLKTLKLAFPIILGQVGPVFMHAIDALMLGQVGVLPLTASAFGGHFVGFWLVCGIGVCTAVHVHVSKAQGEGNEAEGVQLLKHGLWLGILYGGFWTLAIVPMRGIFYYLGQPLDVVIAAEGYIIVMTWAAIPVFAFHSIKNYYECCGRPWFPFWVMVAGVGLNVLLNWLLIYGRWGFPEMGVTGAGLATFASRVFMMLVLVGALLQWLSGRYSLSLKSFFALSKNTFRKMLSVALPSSVQLFFEMSCFSLSGIMAGWLGKVVLASHHVTMNYVALVFVVPLGLSFATTIRVGEALGKSDSVGLRRIAWGSFAGAGVLMAIWALISVFLREPIALFFVKGDDEVVELIGVMLLVVAIYLLVQAIQVNATGALRGLGDVKFPMVVNLIACWGIALPVGYLLAFKLAWGGVGLWVGLLIGMFFGAITLGVRLLSKLPK